MRSVHVIIVGKALRFSGMHLIWPDNVFFKSELKVSNPSFLEVFPSDSYHYSSFFLLSTVTPPHGDNLKKNLGQSRNLLFDSMLFFA